MIIGVITFLFIILSIYIKKSKPLYIMLFVWMWILMAFTTRIADEEIYMSRYASSELWYGSSEIIYTAIISLFNKLGFTFYQFKATITFVQLVLMFSTIWKMARYPNLVACLYMIYPFPLNIAQMRHTLATAVFVFAIRYLFDDKAMLKTKKFKLTLNDVKYIASILIATCIHSASIIWLVLLLAKKFNLRKNIIFMTVINILGVVISPTNIVKVLNSFGAGARMAAYFSSAYQASSWRNYAGPLIKVTFTAGLLIFLCIYILKNKSSYANTDQVLFLMKADIAILCIYGLIIKYTGEVYRLQESMTILNLIVITNAFKPAHFRKTVWSIKNAIAFNGLIFFICGIAYIAIGMYLVPTIVDPILNNNMLLKTIWP